jgi:tetratricopeptide (TPR) repeat protein
VKENIKIDNLTNERAEAYFMRGINKSKVGEVKGAIQDLTTAVELSPTYSNAYFSRAMIRSQSGDQMGAVLDFTSSIKLRSDYPEAYYLRGILKNSLGEVHDGCLDLSKAGELGYQQAYKVIASYCN